MRKLPESVHTHMTFEALRKRGTRASCVLYHIAMKVPYSRRSEHTSTKAEVIVGKSCGAASHSMGSKCMNA